MWGSVFLMEKWGRTLMEKQNFADGRAMLHSLYCR